MDEAAYFENIASYKLLAKKEVGQNFLVDSRVAGSIVASLEAKEGEKVLEIGCGTGALTYFLEQSKASVDAIDIDEAMLAKTGNDFASSNHLKVFYGNACDYDYSSYQKIVGNLPYYITSLILEKVLLGAEKASRLVFMVQKEAGERILAKPSTKDYGPLNILLDLLYQKKKILTVSRNSFVPAPHVESCVYQFDRKETPIPYGEKVYRLALEMFKFRRKTIYNNLKTYLGDGEIAKAILSEAHLNENLRPENLSPSQYESLFQSVSKRKGE